MEVEIRKGMKNIDWDELDKVFQSAPLGERPANVFKKACEYSPVIVSAWVDNKIVGFGRAFTDFIAYGSIYDVVVDKNHQGQGIGKKIMNAILSDLKKCGYVTLFVAPGRAKFYETLGFSNLKSGMIAVKGDQAKEHLVSKGHI